jgi:hypothetical protein
MTFRSPSYEYTFPPHLPLPPPTCVTLHEASFLGLSNYVLPLLIIPSPGKLLLQNYRSYALYYKGNTRETHMNTFKVRYISQQIKVKKIFFPDI